MATDAPPSGEDAPPTAASPTSTTGETVAAAANVQEEPTDAAKASQAVGGPQDGTAGAEADSQPPPEETEASTAAESGEDTTEDPPCSAHKPRTQLPIVAELRQLRRCAAMPRRLGGWAWRRWGQEVEKVVGQVQPARYVTAHLQPRALKRKAPATPDFALLVANNAFPRSCGAAPSSCWCARPPWRQSPFSR